MTWQYVYLVRSGKNYKVGITNNPKARINQIQVGNPEKIDFVSCYLMRDASLFEKAFNNVFMDKQVNREWFSLTKKDIETFNNICENLGGQKQENNEIKQPAPSVIDTIKQDRIPIIISIALMTILLLTSEVFK